MVALWRSAGFVGLSAQAVCLDGMSLLGSFAKMCVIAGPWGTLLQGLLSGQLFDLLFPSSLLFVHI